MAKSNRKLALVGGSGATEAETALRALARVLAPFLRDEFDAARASDELVDVLQTVPGPRRAILHACRTGAIANAAKVGRRWCASRAAVNAWLMKRGPQIIEHATVEDGDDLEDLRARIARGG